MEPFPQNFEVLTQRGDVINPKFARKRTQTCLLCTNGDRKMKIKIKRDFEVIIDSLLKKHMPLLYADPILEPIFLQD